MTDVERFWMSVYLVMIVICFFIDIELGIAVTGFIIISSILYVMCTVIITEGASDKWIPCPTIHGFRI